MQVAYYDETPMWEAWLSRTWFPAVMVADDLGIFSSLDESPATSERLSTRLDLNPTAVATVLPLLASLGFIVATDGLYSLTATGRRNLLSSSSWYWGGVIAEGRAMDPVAARMKSILLEGHKGAWAARWSKGTLTSETAEAITRFMHSHSVGAADRLSKTELFSRKRRVLDVGGGSGCYSIALARANRQLRCTVLELPHACPVTQRYIANAGMEERVDTFGMDMFETAWPTGYDAVLLSNIFHDWPESSWNDLAARAFGALAPGGEVFVHEALLGEDGNGPQLVASFSVLVMLGTHGRQLTHRELSDCLLASGFVGLKRQALPPLHDLVYGRRPDE